MGSTAYVTGEKANMISLDITAIQFLIYLAYYVFPPDMEARSKDFHRNRAQVALRTELVVKTSGQVQDFPAI